MPPSHIVGGCNTHPQGPHGRYRQIEVLWPNLLLAEEIEKFCRAGDYR